MFAAGFLVGKVAEVAGFGGAEGRSITISCFQLASCYVKLQKVAYISGVEECDQYLIFILVYILSVAKVAEVAELMGVQGGWRDLLHISILG